ncbi:sulfurtransferase TusA family protein [Bacillus sp. DTU_2020_1000418_1_SI_GHA_SEK_038]|uniref:sulfurtransferase TusA family protein n=1 Tax=Bacillus sp. DTU_2020_1000418_1_SI_GHA_SEK_038 TaxID=3077585 RepID=UPI0028F0E1BC|nr:sulfurtransferase TusA family protein [Bacillus sp. DTU_2020_1000418_1_SI_GHA_SEK_038]WNS77654.1 sulfurtransferase TusA family protein [Bacillus sp. DTU_2020_1000418_1_SI_GHA_SEK_038]
MNSVKADMVLDAKGLACPMPIVKTKKAMTNLEAGQVLEVQATDKGSKADIQAWAKSSGHQYLGTLEDGDVLNHYLRKSAGEEAADRKHPNVVSNEELDQNLGGDGSIVVLDVRESEEFVFNHIPDAISIPLGELDERMGELPLEKEIYVVCRTGNRSDFAAQKLAEKGFSKVFNVVPGMSEWSGRVAGIQK